jgi:protein phosphatase
MRLDIAAQTDTGRRKSINEDACAVFHDDMEGLRLFSEGAMMCVADGLGGHGGGEIASKLAISMMRDILKMEVPPATEGVEAVDERDAGPLPLIRSGIQRANESIYKTNQDLVLQNMNAQSGKTRPMGTTLLCAVVEPGWLYIGNVGDSRCYLIREGDIVKVTEDHSWVDEQVKLGLMSKAEAETDRRKNIVTRCVGTHQDITVDTYRWSIVPGDMLLLCTDGLVNMVPDRDIEKVFRKYGTAAEIAQRLVAMANENGGKDNITVVVANISPSMPRLLYLRLRAFLRRGGLTAKGLLLLIVYGLLCAAGGYFLHQYYPLF